MKDGARVSDHISLGVIGGGDPGGDGEACFAGNGPGGGAVFDGGSELAGKEG